MASCPRGKGVSGCRITMDWRKCLADENTLVVTRTTVSWRSDERSHTLTHTLRIEKSGDSLKGTVTGPGKNGEYITNFIGSQMPPMPKKPDLSKITYGKPIILFNGKDL